MFIIIALVIVLIIIVSVYLFMSSPVGMIKVHIQSDVKNNKILSLSLMSGAKCYASDGREIKFKFNSTKVQNIDSFLRENKDGEAKKYNLYINDQVDTFCAIVPDNLGIKTIKFVNDDVITKNQIVNAMIRVEYPDGSMTRRVIRTIENPVIAKL